MRYAALATDFDGTLAHDGLVPPDVLEKLGQLRESGRRLILVTGRLLDDLASAIHDLALFDAIVAENGALAYNPTSKRETAVGPPYSSKLVNELTVRGVQPLEVGRSVVATQTRTKPTCSLQYAISDSSCTSFSTKAPSWCCLRASIRRPDSRSRCGR